MSQKNRKGVRNSAMGKPARQAGLHDPAPPAARPASAGCPAREQWIRYSAPHDIQHAHNGTTSQQSTFSSSDKRAACLGDGAAGAACGTSGRETRASSRSRASRSCVRASSLAARASILTSLLLEPASTHFAWSFLVSSQCCRSCGEMWAKGQRGVTTEVGVVCGTCEVHTSTA